MDGFQPYAGYQHPYIDISKVDRFRRQTLEEISVNLRDSCVIFGLHTKSHIGQNEAFDASKMPTNQPKSKYSWYIGILRRPTPPVHRAFLNQELLPDFGQNLPEPGYR